MFRHRLRRTGLPEALRTPPIAAAAEQVRFGPWALSAWSVWNRRSVHAPVTRLEPTTLEANP
jgi:hypothetical protein